MKLSFSALLVLFAAGAMAQPNPGYHQPLGQVQQFLQLTDAQLRAILTNNREYNEFGRTKQERIWQVQSEIAAETAKQQLDPTALGVRYAEIETICRQMIERATEDQKKNTAILSDAQKAKIQVLLDAVKLAPVISEAQSGNLMGTFTYAPSYFRSDDMLMGYAAGPAFGQAGGCYVASSGAAQPGGESSGAAAAVPASRTSGAAPNRVTTPHPMSVAQKVKQIIVEQLGVDEAQVDDTASFIDDLGADSLDIVELVMAFELAFDIDIPDEDAEKITTVKKAVAYIENKSARK